EFVAFDPLLNHSFFVSRAQRSTKWCAADPGPLRHSASKTRVNALLGGPGSAVHRSARAARCTASGTRGVFKYIQYPYPPFKQPISFPRRVFAPGFCILASLTRNEGWRSAERRTDACEASVGPALSGQARHLARRLASPYGGRPPPGAHTVAISGVGAALPLTGIAAGSVTANSSHPGRSARRRGPCLPGRRLRIAAAGRHASLRPQDRL